MQVDSGAVIEGEVEPRVAQEVVAEEAEERRAGAEVVGEDEAADLARRADRK